MFTIIRISGSSWQLFLWNITGPQQAFGLDCMHRLKRLIQPPWIDLQFNMKRSRSCPPFSSFPSRGLPVEISLQRLVSHFSGEKHLLCSREHVQEFDPCTSDSSGLTVWCVGSGAERCKILEAEDLGSGPGPAGYQLSCVILAKSLSLSEPQAAFL